MSLRALLFDHIWLKLFSLVLATLIWLAVWANLRNESVLPKRTFSNHPILVLSESTDRAAALISPEGVTVTVRGPADLMHGLKVEDIDVFVRLNDKRSVSGELPIHVHVPAGASVTLLTPMTALVTYTASNRPKQTP